MSAVREMSIDLAREQLARHRPLVLVAEGHSMWPLVRDGEVVTIEPMDAPPAIGDVVLFAVGARLVLHRVVAIRGDDVVTKGDARPRPDAPIPRGSILGRLRRSRANRLLAFASLHGARPLSALLQRARLALSRAPR